MTAVSRSEFRLAGASMLVLAALAAPALAQQGPESATQNYQIFHSHVAWRAAAVIARDAAQSGATWKEYNSHIAHSDDANWLPLVLPGEVEKIPVRVHKKSSYQCPALTC
jgi:hypothetical protein